MKTPAQYCFVVQKNMRNNADNFYHCEVNVIKKVSMLTSVAELRTFDGRNFRVQNVLITSVFCNELFRRASVTFLCIVLLIDYHNITLDN